MAEWLADIFGFTSGTSGRVLATVIVLAALLVARWLVVRTAIGRIEDSEVLFRARKAATYVATTVFLILAGWIWIDAFDNVATFLGLIGAGIAIALADVLKNLAGWVYIVLRHPFRVGDRIEVDGHAGDVIDVRVFRFSILEIRNWVDADQSTGRIMHFPNGTVFTAAVANFTEGFPHIWHEVPMLITFESDWQRAREIMEKVLEPHVMSDEELGAEAEIRKASRKYFIRYKELRPIVYVTVRESGVLLTARLLVAARHRRGTDSEIWQQLLKEIAAEPTINLAYPTARTVITDPLRFEPTDRSE